MGGVSSTLRTGGTQGPEAPRPVAPARDPGITDPSVDQLLGMMRQSIVGQKVERDVHAPTMDMSQATTMVRCLCPPDGRFVLEPLPPGEEPGDGETVLNHAQTVYQEHGVLLDPHTDYVLTNAFSGCTFMLLQLGGAECAFHVHEARDGSDLPRQLAPYAMVAEAIQDPRFLPPGTGPDDLLRMVDAYLALPGQMGREELGSIRTMGEGERLNAGLALMVMDNVQDVAGFALTQDRYAPGHAEPVEEPSFLCASAMMARDGGRMNMLVQGALNVSDPARGISEQRVVDVQQYPLNPPDVYRVLQALAFPEAVPGPGDLPV